jgi:hypothetical protein
MIVLAPSIIKGRAYRWIEPQLDIAPLPPWLAELAGVSHHVEQGDGEYEAIYSEQEFRTLLNLIPVSRYDDDHDAWLELMLACSHASTVDDGEDAFMKWTIADGPGNRIGYSSDFDVILARWQYNYAKRNMRGGVKVGTFNRHVLAAAPNALVKSPITAEAQFADDQENEDAADTAALAARWRKLDRQPRAARHRAAVRKQREWIARRPSHIRGGRQ